MVDSTTIFALCKTNCYNDGMKNLQNERLWAAAFGPKIIPFVRRKRQHSHSEHIEHRDVDNLLKRVAYKEYSFKNAIGDTIKEKFESLWVLCYEISKELRDRGSAHNLMIASPELAAVFECYCNHSLWNPYSDSRDISYVMRVHSSIGDWRLWKDKTMDPNLLLITGSDFSDGIGVRSEIFW